MPDSRSGRATERATGRKRDFLCLENRELRLKCSGLSDSGWSTSRPPPSVGPTATTEMEDRLVVLLGPRVSSVVVVSVTVVVASKCSVYGSWSSMSQEFSLGHVRLDSGLLCLSFGPSPRVCKDPLSLGLVSVNFSRGGWEILCPTRDSKFSTHFKLGKG